MKLLTIRETPPVELKHNSSISISFTGTDYKIGIFNKESGFYYSDNKLYVNNKNMYSNIPLKGAIVLSFQIDTDPFGLNVCTSIISSEYNLLTPVIGRFKNLNLPLRIEGEVDIHTVHITQTNIKFERIATLSKLFTYSSI